MLRNNFKSSAFRMSLLLGMASGSELVQSQNAHVKKAVLRLEEIEVEDAHRAVMKHAATTALALLAQMNEKDPQLLKDLNFEDTMKKVGSAENLRVPANVATASSGVVGILALAVSVGGLLDPRVTGDKTFSLGLGAMGASGTASAIQSYGVPWLNNMPFKEIEKLEHSQIDQIASAEVERLNALMNLTPEHKKELKDALISTLVELKSYKSIGEPGVFSDNESISHGVRDRLAKNPALLTEVLTYERLHQKLATEINQQDFKTLNAQMPDVNGHPERARLRLSDMISKLVMAAQNSDTVKDQYYKAAIEKAIIASEFLEM